MNSLKSGLRDEIDFWRDLMAESGLEINSIEYQRMTGALDIAQTRLKQLLEIEGDPEAQIAHYLKH